MLRILIDQDVDHDILRGVLRRLPHIDFLTASQAQTGSLDDVSLLRWAAVHGRVLVTQDMKSMPASFLSLYDEGVEIAGIIIAPRSLPISKLIDDLTTIIACSENDEWPNVIRILPM